MLFDRLTSVANPHAPFEWVHGEVRLVGDLGDRYEADVFQRRDSSWTWSARVGHPHPHVSLSQRFDPESIRWRSTPGGVVDSEADAMDAAVAWLRLMVLR